MTQLKEKSRAHADRISALFDAEAASLLRYFLRRVEIREDAADLVAETALTLWRRTTDLPADPERARMWMYGVARRTLSTHRRGVIRRSALADRLRGELAVSGATTATDSRADEVATALSALPARERELVELVHWEGFSVTEAAVVLGIRAGAAHTRYSRARNRLRTFLA